MTWTCATGWRRRRPGTSAFREATWEEALSLTAQELMRIRGRTARTRSPRSPRPSAPTRRTTSSCGWCGRALGTNNVDHCTRLCHSTSVAAMSRALSTSAASGSMREIEEACDVIFIAGANTTETHPVFGALIKRARDRRAPS